MFRIGPYARVRFEDPPPDPPPDPSPSGPADWIGGLPEDLRNTDVLGDHKLGEGEKMVSVPPSVIKSHLHAQGMIGKDKVAVPGEGASEADWAAFWQRLGAPADGKGYEFAAPQIEGADAAVIEKLTDGFRDVALKTGLTKKQAEDVYNWYLQAYAGEINEVTQLAEQAREQALATLKTKFGDGYEQKIKLAKTLVERYANDDIRAWLDSSGAGDSPQYIEFLANIAGQFSEDVLKLGTTGAMGMMTPEQAQREINTLMAHPGYMDGQHPEHKDIVERISKLNEVMYGTTPVGYRGMGAET